MTPRRIKVLLASPLAPPVGGITTWTNHMLRTPVDADIDRVHVNTSPGDGGYVVHLRAGRLARQAAVTANVCRRLVVERADVVHVASSYLRAWPRDALFLNLAHRMGAATILHLRGGDFERVYRDATPARQRALLDQLRRCSAVVAITIETERFLRGLGLTNTHCVPNCIDVRPRALRRTSAAIRRWLFVGYVSRAKGVPELLAALRRFPDAHLTLVGPTIVDGDENGAELVAAAGRDPDLRGRLTHVEQAPQETARAAYANHDVFVFPTLREGFPNAVLEAMEAALPIVATRVGAIPDMLVDGEHGLLVDAGDQRALEAAIGRIVADPEFASRLGAAARARAAALYEVGHIASIWYSLYRTLGRRARAAKGD